MHPFILVLVATSRNTHKLELELELIQSHMAQKPMLRGEVGARALRVRSVSREKAWASAGVQGAWVGAPHPALAYFRRYFESEMRPVF